MGGWIEGGRRGREGGAKGEGDFSSTSSGREDGRRHFSTPSPTHISGC